MITNPSNTKMQPKTHQMTWYRLCYSRYRWVRVWARWGFWSVTVRSHGGQVRLMCHGQDTAQAWYISLVGGFNLPLWKNITSSVGVILPNVWKNKTCSKPPTSYCHNPFQSCKPCVGRANCSSISRWYRYGCMIQLSTMAYDGMRWYIAMKSDEINLYII